MLNSSQHPSGQTEFQDPLFLLLLGWGEGCCSGPGGQVQGHDSLRLYGMLLTVWLTREGETRDLIPGPEVLRAEPSRRTWRP